MNRPTLRWLKLLGPVVLLFAAVALARIGGGENYVSSSPSSSGESDGGGIPIELIWFVLMLTVEYPHVMLPLLGMGAVAYVIGRRRGNFGNKTQKAFQQAEAERRTQVSPAQVQTWALALKHKDPAFELQALYEHARKTFIAAQEAWFRRDLSPVRAVLSDATYQRLTSQLDLQERQGIRGANADLEVLDVTLIGLEQTEFFDTVHLRIKARIRDLELPATTSDEEARTRAKAAAQEAFIEVWSFVRKPGAQTKIGEDVFQGKCPNCGALFSGGHTNNCEFCKAVVNSGNYDWTLSQITQGVEHVGLHQKPAGAQDLRERDPGLNLEVLEDRASLVFWKWVSAQSRQEPRELAKLATAEMLARLAAELESFAQQQRRKVFLHCAVGGVRVLGFRLAPDGADEAEVEIRWSARMAVLAEGEKPPKVPPVNQRWVFVLGRKAGAQSNPASGMATSRCPSCNAPLSDTLTSTCDFCSAELSFGDRDWVLRDARPYEAWRALRAAAGKGAPSTAGVDAASSQLVDLEERKRLLSMMAAMAAADGVVDEKERKLLKMCSVRWSVPWPEVEQMIAAGPQVFDRLVPPGSPEAVAFLRALVDMALVDGVVDKQERALLQAASHHLGVADKLAAMLAKK